MRVEVLGPVDAEAVAPVPEHLFWGAEAGPRVDHRRPADGAAHRNRYLRAPLGDRQASVAVERCDRVERLLRVVLAIEALAGLEHDHVESLLGQGRRGDSPAGPRADDHDVAFLAVARGLGIAERPARLRPRAVAEPAACLEADPPFDLGRDRVAQRREDLAHQQELAVDAEARSLHAMQKVFAGGEVEAAEAPGEGQ